MPSPGFLASNTRGGSNGGSAPEHHLWSGPGLQLRGRRSAAATLGGGINFRRWHISADLRLCAGEPDDAIEHIEASQRLSPRGSVGARSFIVGSARFINRRFDEAVRKLLVAVQELPRHMYSYRYLAACYAHMGRLDEARQIIERLRTITPHVVPSVTHLRNPAHRELFLSGLRLAADEAV
jgi:tetratricopeptide (TPR) repeat protein